jgi:dipeptidyl aminopeptidase/acylaminoacyl peptidase
MKPSRWLLTAPLLALLGATPAATTDDDLERAVTLMAKICSASSPSFSPDGKTLAFTSNIGGVAQIWTVDAAGGYPQQVTAFDDAVTGVEWSPDGRWLAFALAPGGGMNVQVYLVRPDGTGVRRLTDGGKENNALGAWSYDGSLLATTSNRRSGAAIDPYLYDVTAGTSRMVLENTGVGGFDDLSRDKKLALMNRLVNRGDNNVYLVDVATGKETLLTPHEGPGTFAGTFSPDARTVYLSTNAGRDLGAFARMELGADGRPGKATILAERPDAELQGFTLNDAGTMAALVWNVAGRGELELFDLAAGRSVAKPKLPGEIAFGLDFSKDGKQLAIVLSGAALPADVWVMDVASGSFRQVTKSPHAGVELAKLVRPELVKFKAHDGLELSGWLYKPAGAAAPFPLVLSFHGGPEGQERPFFNSQYQALLLRGIAVLAPNVRGSSGFGKKFVNLDNGALRVEGVKDIKDCVDAAVKAGADPQRIGIMGGSYGGYMVRRGADGVPGPLRRGRGPLRRRELRDVLQAHRALDGGDLEDRVRRSRQGGRDAAAPLADPQGGPHHGADDRAPRRERHERPGRRGGAGRGQPEEARRAGRVRAVSRRGPRLAQDAEPDQVDRRGHEVVREVPEGGRGSDDGRERVLLDRRRGGPDPAPSPRSIGRVSPRLRGRPGAAPTTIPRGDRNNSCFYFSSRSSSGSWLFVSRGPREKNPVFGDSRVTDPGLRPFL